MFKEFSANANKLLGLTVWILDDEDDDKLKKRWICRTNIWKMMRLWEDNRLFLSSEEAENAKKFKVQNLRLIFIALD